MDKKLYYLVKNYMKVILPIFYYRYTDSCQRVIEQTLNLYLSVWNAHEYKDKITSVIYDTFILQTKEDCVLLEDFDTSNYSTERDFYSLKKRLLMDTEAFADYTFSLTFFEDSLNDSVRCGEKYSCKLKAYIAWDEGERDLAVNLWKRLAYWGDLDSIRALIYCANQMGLRGKSETWQSVYNALSYKSSSLFCVDEANKRLSADEMRVVELIHCIKSIGWIKDKDCLHYSMLDYVINSRESVDEVIRNVSRGDVDFNLLRRRDYKERTYKIGF